MNDDTTTNDTTTPDPQGDDPIRPAHYRDDSGRDRIDVWCATLGGDELLAAIGATVDRYISRAGRKPGVSAEQDRAKAAEVARRYFEEWGEGADELLGDFLGDLGHDREAIDDLLLAAARPRTSTPPAEVTPQQAAGARPLPTREQQDVALVFLDAADALIDEILDPHSESRTTAWVRYNDAKRKMEQQRTAQQATREHVSTTMMPVAAWADRQRPAPQANPLAGVTPWEPNGSDDSHKWYPTPTRDVLRIVNADGELAIAVRDLLRILAYHAQHDPDALTPHGWQQPPSARDDHAAALQRERERADRAERALRLERGTPLLGDLPTGWTKRMTSELWWYAHPHADYDDAFDAEARRNLSGRWEWWATDDGHGGHRTTAAEAIDAAHAALNAQRSDNSSAAGEGEVAP